MSTGPSPNRTWIINHPKDFGRTIAGVRRSQGLTQEQLAELTGVNRTYLAKLEAGSETIELQRLLLALRRMGAELTVSLKGLGGAEED